MPVFAIKGFRGAVPRLDPRLLKPNQAQRAWNLRFTSGRIDPVRGPKLVYSSGLQGDIQTMFRYRHFPSGRPYTDNWLTWDTDVNVVKSPLANDDQGRFYYSSADFDPRVSNYDMAIANLVYPDAWFALGVPSPTAAPAVAPGAGTGSDENRAYLYTFVNSWGEESGPSPASAVVAGKPDAVWAVTGMQLPPPNSGNVSGATADTPVSGQVEVQLDTVFGLAAHERIVFAGVEGMTDLNGSKRIVSVNAATNRVVVVLASEQVYTTGGTWAREAPLNVVGMRKRVYRTAGTNPSFVFVGEVPGHFTDFNDNVAPTMVGEVLATAGTLPPPKNLTNLISLPNGCLVGLAGNEVCFSDPYVPYSWPVANRYSFSGVAVALVKASNSVIVLTDGFPFMLVGTDPEAMSPTPIESYAPCVAKRGVVDVGGGALYPSYDGMWLIVPGSVKKLTQGLYRDEEWQSIHPETFVASFFDGQYFADHMTDDGVRRIWILDIAEPDSVSEIDDTVQSLHRNEHDGRLYVARGNGIYKWDADDAYRYEADWLSYLRQHPRPVLYAWAQVFADFDQILPVDDRQLIANQALMDQPSRGRGSILGASLLVTEIAGSLLRRVREQARRRVQLTVYYDKQAVYTVDVTDAKPFRLPVKDRKEKAELVAIGLAPSIPVNSVVLATDIDELREVAP